MSTPITRGTDTAPKISHVAPEKYSVSSDRSSKSGSGSGSGSGTSKFSHAPTAEKVGSSHAKGRDAIHAPAGASVSTSDTNPALNNNGFSFFVAGRWTTS